jgi:HD-GYP domain-containing protein (c-di-GMP phosphodiesterase class II)
MPDLEALRDELSRLREEFRAVSDIGMRLSGSLELGDLLPSILTEARRLTRSEAGTLYVRKGAVLAFQVAQNDRLDRARDGGIVDPPRIELPLDRTSLAGLAAIEQRTLAIDDVREHPSYDREAAGRFGYEVVSMLVVPMSDPRGELSGVLQLLNRTAADGSAIEPFDAHSTFLCEVLASHAATALNIAQLYAEQREVFECLVRYSATAIDARDPATAGHSSRVASYSVQLADEMGGFTREELREIRFGGIFHDVGKIGVRECVLTKAQKLAPEALAVVEARFDAACEAEMAEGWRESGGREDSGRLDAAKGRVRLMREDLELVRMLAIPGPVDEDALSQLSRLAGASYTGWDGRTRALLTPEEVDALGVRKGSLTDQERLEIQHHVDMSHDFLIKLPFPPDLARVPEIAFTHHERMDGSGYPRGLSGEEILVQARVVMVADVFDALTAEDRPYKKPMAPERALRVIEHEGSSGAYDARVVDALRRLVERGRLVPLGHGRDAEPERPFIAERDAWR